MKENLLYNSCNTFIDSNAIYDELLLLCHNTLLTKYIIVHISLQIQYIVVQSKIIFKWKFSFPVITFLFS